jgi:hypothetical protein
MQEFLQWDTEHIKHQGGIMGVINMAVEVFDRCLPR